jgi:excisionase family DNA binding protein
MITTKRKRGRPRKNAVMPQSAAPSPSPEASPAPILAPRPGKLCYSIAEVTQMTGLSDDHISRLIAHQALPARKAGRRTLIMHDDLSAYLAGLPRA